MSPQYFDLNELMQEEVPEKKPQLPIEQELAQKLAKEVATKGMSATRPFIALLRQKGVEVARHLPTYWFADQHLLAALVAEIARLTGDEQVFELCDIARPQQQQESLANEEVDGVERFYHADQVTQKVTAPNAEVHSPSSTQRRAQATSATSAAFLQTTNRLLAGTATNIQGMDPVALSKQLRSLKAQLLESTKAFRTARRNGADKQAQAPLIARIEQLRSQIEALEAKLAK